MFKYKSALVKQRIKYLINGNFHGVSANWLEKQGVNLSPSTTHFVSSSEHMDDLSLLDIEEGARVFERIVSDKSGTNYRKNYDCEAGLASFLYAYILARKPKVVIETGIANGITTNVIMSALEKTGGLLHSFDVDPATSNVYSGSGKWRFHLLSGNLNRNFSTQISEIPSIDLWLHDSDHGYVWQTFEYALAINALKPNGVLVSDDIDSSTAWGYTTDLLFRASYGVFDKRKFFGVAIV